MMMAHKAGTSRHHRLSAVLPCSLLLVVALLSAGCSAAVHTAAAVSSKAMPRHLMADGDVNGVPKAMANASICQLPSGSLCPTGSVPCGPSVTAPSTSRDYICMDTTAYFANFSVQCSTPGLVTAALNQMAKAGNLTSAPAIARVWFWSLSSHGDNITFPLTWALSAEHNTAGTVYGTASLSAFARKVKVVARFPEWAIYSLDLDISAAGAALHALPSGGAPVWLALLNGPQSSVFWDWAEAGTRAAGPNGPFQAYQNNYAGNAKTLQIIDTCGNIVFNRVTVISGTVSASTFSSPSTLSTSFVLP